jgi:hypothetical protein
VREATTALLLHLHFPTPVSTSSWRSWKSEASYFHPGYGPFRVHPPIELKPMSRTRLLLTTLVLASVASSAQPENSKAGPVQDNSFFLEEAYNQEAGVVQHISTFNRDLRSRDWSYSLTQEWPVGTQTHQFSYTLPVTHSNSFSDGRAGLGDIALNYRYQLLGNGDAKLAIAPRFSILLPTGKYREGRGAGAMGYQGQLPVSWVITDSLVSHTNVGFTITPRARDGSGFRVDLGAWNVGQSLVWLVHPQFNVLLEWVHTRAQTIAGPGAVNTERSTLISPGIRWAHNLSSGMQIVPGIAVPLGLGSNRNDRSIFFYLSFEHPFKK